MGRCILACSTGTKAFELKSWSLNNIDDGISSRSMMRSRVDLRISCGKEANSFSVEAARASLIPSPSKTFFCARYLRSTIRFPIIVPTRGVGCDISQHLCFEDLATDACLTSDSVENIPNGMFSIGNGESSATGTGCCIGMAGQLLLQR